MAYLELTGDNEALISKIVDPEIIAKRLEFCRDSVLDMYAAKDIARHLKFRGYESTVVLFRSNGNDIFNTMKYWNYKTKSEGTCTTLAVVYTGKYVMDAFNSDTVIPASEYVEMLEKINPEGVRLDRSYVSEWHCKDGSNVRLTYEDVKNGRE